MCECWCMTQQLIIIYILDFACFLDFPYVFDFPIATKSISIVCWLEHQSSGFYIGHLSSKLCYYLYKVNLMKDYVVYVTCVVTRTSFLPLSWLIYMINSSTFQSTVNKNTFVIRHNVTIKNRCVIFPMECYLCEKSKYVQKSEYRFN